MSDQIDVESALPSLPHGPLRSDTDDSKASTGPTFVTSPRPGATLDTRFDEKSPLDGGHGHARSTTMDSFPGMLERRNTGINQMAYGDPAAKIWGLYLSRAEKVDRDQSERWRGNTDGILVFTGLFSAVVASFILVSYQDLQPDSSETTNLLLSRISQQLSALSTDNGTAPPSLTVDKIESTFSPSASAIRVNIMWFLSLSFSLYCALQATLMQQWTRKYLQSIDRPYAPARRARIRAFFAEGVQKWRLITAVEALPVFLHISVLLFFVGLVDWLLQINHVLGWLQLGLSILGVLGYFEITFLPLLFPDTPYHTQLTSMFWGVRESLPLIFLWLRRKDEAVLSSIKARRQKLKDGMRRTFEETAFGRSWRMDARAIKWTLASLDEDTELEEFLDGLPGLFRASKPEDVRAFKDHLEPTIAPVTDRLLATCSINLLPDRVLRRRLTACLGAIWSFSSSTERHFRAIWDQWDGATADDKWGPLSTETWSVAQSRTADIDPRVAFRAHCVQALAAVMWRNGRWQGPETEEAALLQRQLGASSAIVSDYLSKKGHLEMAVAANLLTRALPLLSQLDDLSGALKRDLRAILNAICKDVDASDASDELKARFVPNNEVIAVFYAQEATQPPRYRRSAFDINGPWAQIISAARIEPKNRREEDRQKALQGGSTRKPAPILTASLSRGDELV